MEIDSAKIKLSVNSENPDAFAISYTGQRLDNNPNFLKWKTEMFQKYGDDAKLFKCLIDNVIFCGSLDDYKTFPYYLCNCPICQTPTCYFCSKFCEDNYRNGNCCLKRRIRCMIIQDGLVYIKPVGRAEQYPPNFSSALIYLYFPVLNFLFLIFFFHLSFFFGMIRKDAENNKNRPSYNEVYETYLREHKIFKIISVINIAFGIILTIPLIFPYYCFVIILSFISVLFNLYPVFYYIGFVFGGK